MKRYTGNERGGALFISLSLIAMLTLIGLMAVNTTNTEIDLSFYKVHGDKAFYVAEAGAKRAMNELIGDSTWRTGFTAMAFAGGSFTVQLTDSTTIPALGDTVIVTSTGTSHEALATVEVTMAPEIYYPFRHAMFGRDAVDIRNSMYIDSYNSDSGSYLGTRELLNGDVGSNGTVDVYNGATVGGDVSSSLTGGVTVVNPSDVLGTITDTAPVQDIPDTPQSEYDWAEANNDNLTGISGTYTYDPSDYSFVTTGTVTLSSGVYFFTDFTLKNNASLVIAPGAEVIIYITDLFDIRNTGGVNSGGDPSDLIMYVQDDFVLKNSGDFSGVIYAPTASVDLRNSGDFYGSIVADNIIAHNSAQFHYDRDLGNIRQGTVGDYQLIAWREL